MQDSFEGRSARCTQAILEQIRSDWGGHGDLWVFGYASLIWRPEFEAAERTPATVYGYHRALEMTSRINRGTPECPGLVFALVSGGSCRGMAYRIPHERVEVELERLWKREMALPVYDPKWLPCRTPRGNVAALGFTLSRASPGYTGTLSEERLAEVFASARGCFGTTLDYLLHTADCLAENGIRDRAIERLVSLARRQGLVGGSTAAV
ncbi:MAG: ChaC family protein [Rhizobacter sp.]|nr:ChaC family protein [Rhizobacter sp.]